VEHLVEQPGFDHGMKHPVAKAAHLKETQGLSLAWNWVFESNKAAETESRNRPA
jgi:hypothetical protein